MLNRTALSKIECKSLLRAGHCARLFERSVGVIFLIQPRGASFAAPCSKQIGLEWQNLYKRVKHKVYFEVLQRAQLSFAEGSANDEQGILNKFNSRAEE